MANEKSGNMAKGVRRMTRMYQAATNFSLGFESDRSSGVKKSTNRISFELSIELVANVSGKWENSRTGRKNILTMPNLRTLELGLRLFQLWIQTKQKSLPRDGNILWLLGINGHWSNTDHIIWSILWAIFYGNIIYMVTQFVIRIY